ncbi:hypothetical protein U9M48_018510 [Paspalum notatum var. saurae]|uniref:Uncharacterized protein n=1 Tax=Paspalum notatum var. saurae TaxID=547442 RepID=A0AAQ3WQD1_PASNO
MATVGEVEDLEPLFDYKRVQPRITFRFDDSDLEKADIFKHCNKRPKVDAAAAAEEGKPDEKAAAAKVVDVDDEDWLLPPPPKAVFVPTAEDNSAVRELRICMATVLALSRGQHHV